jgi:hypothetical protein
MKDELINSLYEDAIHICHTKCTNTWKNSWMWNVQQREIVFHYLIGSDDNYFGYEDINDLSIEISYDNSHSKYRIDIKTRYKVHNF